MPESRTRDRGRLKQGDPGWSLELQGTYDAIDDVEEALERGENVPQEWIDWAREDGSFAGYERLIEADAKTEAVESDPTVNFLRDRDAQTREDYDDLFGSVGPRYEGLSRDAQLGLDALLSDYDEGYDELWEPAELRDYRGDIESEAANSYADPTFVHGQKRVLDELLDLTRPEMTAQERAMMEASRQAREQEFRGTREAILSDARRRGVGGGGAELAAVLDAQQGGANRLMLEDLGAQSNAVDRAMSALDAAGTVSAQGRHASFNEDFMRRSAADDVSRFNAGMRQEYDIFRTEAELKDRTRRGALLGDKARLGAGAIADKFNYGAAPLQFQERATGAKTGAGQGGAQQIASAMATAEGARQAEKAAGLLEPEEGFLDKVLGWF